jgi:tetratricopeptide (TPR) repeat protein
MVRGLALGIAVLLAAPARAEDAGARGREAREARARTACAAGRIDEGIEILARLLTDYRHPNYIFNQARCYQENGRPAQALTRFREYLRVARNASAEERARATRYIQELQAEVAPPPPAVEAQLPPAAPIVPPPAPAELRATPPPAPPPSHRFRRAAITFGAVAVAAGAAGVISSLDVRSLQRSVEQARPGTLTGPQLADRQREARTFEVLQFVGYGVGGVALLGALVFLAVGQDATQPSPQAGVMTGPGGLVGVTLGEAF